MFGLSTTVIAATAVVVLILVLVLLIVLNTRQKKAKALAERVDRQGAADPRFQDIESPGDARQGATVSDEAGDILSPPETDPFAAFAPTPLMDAGTAPAQPIETTQPALEWDAEPVDQAEPDRVTSPAEPGAPAPPIAPVRPAVGQAASAAAAPLADPAAYLITSLLQGQGDLTEAELRRLELYRPGRVIMVAEGMKDQVTGKGKEARLNRLARIQQYAETLRDRAEERTATEQAAAAVHIIEKPEQQPAQAPAELSLDRELSLLPPEPMIAPAAAPAAAPVPAPAPAQPSGPGFAGATTVAAGAAAGGVAWVTSEASDADTRVEEVLEEEPAPFMVESVAELPAVEEVAIIPAEADAFGWEEWRPEEKAPIAGAATPAPATAEDVMSLPAGERAGALAGLPPAELSRALKQSQDRGFKLAVINALEADGSADALFVVNECMEDPDPEVQMYALDTAERLLRRH